MNCSKCGAEVKDGQKFCVVCATPCGFIEKKKCAVCGTELMVGACFCFECGTPVQSSEQSV